MSVIVINYNLEQYIEAAVRSVMSQTSEVLEIIVIDDGSTDGSWGIIQKLAAEDSRIVARRQPNSGRPAGARNPGVDLATGSFVCFLDGDDLFAPEKVAAELAFFNDHPELDVVFHDMQLIDTDGAPTGAMYLRDADYLRHAGAALESIGNDRYLGAPSFYNFMTSCITGIHVSTIMVRRGALDAAGRYFASYDDVGLADDIDMWFRLVRGRRVGYIDRALSSYRQHPAGLSRNDRQMLLSGILAHLRNLDRAKGVLTQAETKTCRSRIARQYQYLGYSLASTGEPAGARRCYRMSFATRPSARAILLWIKSFLPKRRRPGR